MKWLLLCMMLWVLTCTGCTALPAEERSFAVALAVSGEEGAWTVHARIPTYQSGGGYATVSGEGDTVSHALAALDAASPLQLHLGQTRLLVFPADVARSEAFPAVLTSLRERDDLRPQAALAVTESSAAQVMDALTPATGQRLSKSLDALLETRVREGTALSATLAELHLMGERQQAALMNLSLEDGAVSIAGSWPMGADGRVTQPLTPQETQLLSLMLGRMKSGTLSLTEGVLQLTEATADVELLLPTMQQAAVRLQLRVKASSLTEDAIAQAVASACLGVLGRLSVMGCDALGLARQAITHVEDMREWQEADWSARYRDMAWTVSVGVEGATQ